MLWRFRGKEVVVALMVAAAIGYALAGIGTALDDVECNETQLDNDLDEADIETYCQDPALNPGETTVTGIEGKGDFDKLTVGTRGGGSLFGWAEFDGRPEMELVISDPTLRSARVRSADADGDDDVEAIWIGVQGLDLDNDGNVDPEELGLIAGFADIEGDGDWEIVVQDKARARGDYFAGRFGFDREDTDPLEVLWVGVLSETRRSTGAIVAMLDLDSDGDDEILIEPGKEDYIDVDHDGDPDIIIGRRQN